MATREKTDRTKHAKNGREAASADLAGVNVALLKRLSETPGPSGREEQLRKLVIEELTPLVDDIKVDALGNVIATKKGSGNRTVMLAAHMDEIGFMARYVDERGFVRIQPLGGFDPRVLVAQRAILHTASGEKLRGVLTPASKPVHMLGGREARHPETRRVLH